MRRHARRVVLPALALLLSSSPALAQDEQDADVLRGPEVEQTRVPGVESRFGESPMTEQRPMGQFTIPQREFVKMLGTLGGDGVDASLRLSEEQKAELRAIQQEFTQAMRAHMREHAEELRALRKEAGLNDPRRDGDRRRDRRRTGEGDRPSDRRPVNRERDRPARAGERTPPTPEQQAARQALRELMAKGPSPADVQTRMFAVLSEPQQAFMTEQMEAFRQNAVKRREAQQMERYKAEAEKRFDQRDGGVPDEITDEMLERMQIPERAKERLRPLSPEERSEMLKRFRERRGERRRVRDAN